MARRDRAVDLLCGVSVHLLEILREERHQRVDERIAEHDKAALAVRIAIKRMVMGDPGLLYPGNRRLRPHGHIAVLEPPWREQHTDRHVAARIAG